MFVQQYKAARKSHRQTNSLVEGLDPKGTQSVAYPSKTKILRRQRPGLTREKSILWGEKKGLRKNERKGSQGQTKWLGKRVLIKKEKKDYRGGGEGNSIEKKKPWSRGKRIVQACPAQLHFSCQFIKPRVGKGSREPQVHTTCTVSREDTMPRVWNCGKRKTCGASAS